VNTVPGIIGGDVNIGILLDGGEGDVGGGGGEPQDNPFPTFSYEDFLLVEKAIELAEQLAERKECDKALGTDVPSLAALVKQYFAGGPNGTLFDARTSTLVIQDQGANKTVAQYARENKEKVGAFTANVTGPSSSPKVTFLSYYFFSPPNTEFLAQQRAIVLLHEAVHQFGNKGDADFGGSKELTKKIIAGCFPVLAGKLGDID
jgi:hypothetical protein